MNTTFNYYAQEIASKRWIQWIIAALTRYIYSSPLMILIVGVVTYYGQCHSLTIASNGDSVYHFEILYGVLSILVLTISLLMTSRHDSGLMKMSTAMIMYVRSARIDARKGDNFSIFTTFIVTVLLILFVTTSIRLLPIVFGIFQDTDLAQLHSNVLIYSQPYVFHLALAIYVPMFWNGKDCDQIFV